MFIFAANFSIRFIKSIQILHFQKRNPENTHQDNKK